jgi:hypothetical protein
VGLKEKLAERLGSPFTASGESGVLICLIEEVSKFPFS